MVKKLMHIKGMECPNCAMNLERMEDKVPGVRMVVASYHKEEMVIEYDETRVTEEQIKAEVKRLGYEVTAVSAK